MCISIPGRVIALNGALAEVQFTNRTAWLNTLAQPEVQVGDYVVAYANVIITILAEEEAQHIIQALHEMEAAFAEEDEQGRSSAPYDVSPKGV